MRLLRALLRLFFRHLYTTFAWSYDAIAYLVSVGQWAAWVRAAVPPGAADPVLEIGHGPGHLLIELGGRAIGVDPSRQMSRLANRNLRRKEIEPRLVRARAQALPFRSASFGCLVSTFPAEFILVDRSIQEAWRVLRSGASAVIVANAQIRGRSLPDRFAAWLFRVTGQYTDLPPGWSEPFQRVGFQMARENVALPRSDVIRLIASKP